ncbi:MAG TPA: hypothetical protein VJJ27_01280 [Candidatus Paceibacterota bacterium]
MTHISKKPLKTKELDFVSNLFKTIIHNPGILEEILTNVEKIMLAKRLAIICLLSENEMGFLKIRFGLGVSPSTIVRFEREIDSGIYRKTINFYTKMKNKKQFWELTEKILRGGLPSRGRGRWKFLNK